MKRTGIRRYGEKAYVRLENNRIIRKSGILAIVDLDRATYAHVTRDFLRRREKDGRLIVVSTGLPKSFIVYDDGVREETYLSSLGVETMRGRTADGKMNDET